MATKIDEYYKEKFNEIDHSDATPVDPKLLSGECLVCGFSIGEGLDEAKCHFICKEVDELRQILMYEMRGTSGSLTPKYGMELDHIKPEHTRDNIISRWNDKFGEEVVTYISVQEYGSGVFISVTVDREACDYVLGICGNAKSASKNQS